MIRFPFFPSPDRTLSRRSVPSASSLGGRAPAESPPYFGRRFFLHCEWNFHGIPALSRAQARQAPRVEFPHHPAFSRVQARSAPRAHVRELLCVPQSSKERLRRSRTESSAAPPATEELAGEARQVRPDRAACGSVSTDFRLLTGGEVWRAPGPPAPPGIKSLRKLEYPPPPRPRPAEAGISRFGTVSSYRRGLEGVRPSRSPEHQTLAEVQSIALDPAGALQKNGRYGTSSKTRTKSTSK